jgi:chorismate synthase
MSINAVKAVEIGEGVQVAYSRGSVAHDEIAWTGQAVSPPESRGVSKGISNGEDLRIVGYLKPIPTLKRR